MNSCQHHKDCVDDALSKAEIICQDHNLSFTPIRKKILQLMWKNGHKAVKAYDLLETLQKEDSSAKPATVYRALDFLIENKLIHKIESQNSFIGCNHPTRQHNCAFLICNICQEVTECCNNDAIIDDISSNINSNSFHIENIMLEIHGTCQNCTQ